MASDSLDPARRSLAAQLVQARDEAQQARANERAHAAALDRVRHILREWAGQQGHDACWYYPEVFDRLAHLLGADVRAPKNLPPRAEFEAGCRRFQSEQYGMPSKAQQRFADLARAAADVLRYERNHPAGSIVPQEVMARLRQAVEGQEATAALRPAPAAFELAAWEDAARQLVAAGKDSPDRLYSLLGELAEYGPRGPAGLGLGRVPGAHHLGEGEE